jgi:hypothetical protein
VAATLVLVAVLLFVLFAHDSVSRQYHSNTIAVHGAAARMISPAV